MIEEHDGDTPEITEVVVAVDTMPAEVFQTLWAGLGELRDTYGDEDRAIERVQTWLNVTMQEDGIKTRRSIQGSGQKAQKAQLVVILSRPIVGENGLFDKKGAKIADAGEYSPIITVRVDKQNRGKTGQVQQLLVGKFFAVRDIARDPA